jgi:hypothetical protein
MIKVYDNFLGHFEQQNLLRFVNQLPYKMGETDREDTPPVGMVSVLDINDTVLPKKIEEQLERPITSITRCYVNCFTPGEDPFFHIDGDCTTFLYYVNDQVDLDEGGETQFLADDYIHAVPYITDRLVEFNGQLAHKATSFRSKYRFTIAIKYSTKFGDKNE